MAEEPLDHLELARHRDLEGRGFARPARIVARVALLVLPVVALFNVFGQKASDTAVAGDGGALAVHLPDALRGGLIYQSTITIRAEQDLASPRLVFSADWLQGFTLNTIEPAPEGERSDGASLAFDFADMAAGDALRLVMQWQVNPTSTGDRDFDLTLKDGDRTVAVVRRDLRVWP
jgi:hypothetical protein